MHHIYHTEGLILESKNFGETGKYYFIFTRELGMIVASAQGVRKISSKLRFVLQDFAYVKIDLVQGKDIWRITSASKTNELQNISRNLKTLEVFVNVSRLLRRLLPGEDVNVVLFDDLLRGFSMLERFNKEEELRNIEVVIVLRLLNSLGYIGGDIEVMNIIKSPFEENLIFQASNNRRDLLNKINKALKETHL